MILATTAARRHAITTETTIEIIRTHERRYGASAASAFLRDHIPQHPNCMARSAADGHFTASVLLRNAVGHYLLTYHRRYRTWQQLGGHADGNHDLVAVAAREGLEESGLPEFLLDPVPINIDVHAAGCMRGGTRHFDVCFVGVTSGAETIVRSAESLDLRWVAFAEFTALGVSARLQLIATLVERSSSG